MNKYNQSFYKKQMSGSLRSAKIIVPLIHEIIKPTTVIDIGCGVGTWLSVFKELGCKVHGIDGDYVKSEMLKIDHNEFTSGNLAKEIPIKNKFDLAISLEVAEHLPEERAESFIDELCSLAPVIVFSAALPFQGGVNHINEQWQDYWVDLFLKNNFYAFDVIRSQVNNNNKVSMHYRTNPIIFCNKDQVFNYHDLPEWTNNLNLEIYNSFNFVHPEKYLWQSLKVKKYRKLTKNLSLCTVILFLILIILVFMPLINAD
jgi:2-polyprenyl-3-methyl-5-hydroxy-6-metoxy-1,4-benzoquinol methylase